jgi:hypothetical protein
MTSKEMKKYLEEAKDEFDQIPDSEEIEPGLDIDDPSELQLRKACRLIDASEKLLREENSHYILIIDASFIAIERSIHSRLLETGVVEEGDPIFKHDKMYKLGKETGIYDDEYEEKLKQLWQENRSKTYYRDGIPSEKRAEAMHKLAKSVHDYIVGMSNNGHKCLC